MIELCFKYIVTLQDIELHMPGNLMCANVDELVSQEVCYIYH